METNLCNYHHKLLNFQKTNHTPQSRSYSSRPRSRTITKLFTLLITCAVLVSLPIGCSSQCTQQAGCFPPVGNLATGRTVNTSSTCSSGTEYCVFLSTGPDCFPCMPNTTNSPTNVNDNDENTAWLSQIGPGSPPAVLRFDFDTQFLFEETALVFESVRPMTMILERSRDFGVTWEAYRYYSTTCNATFMLPDTLINDNTVLDSLDPVCTSSESLLFPFTGGRVTFSTSQHLSTSISQEVATQYKTVTNLRVQLLDYFQELELSQDSFVYYAISEWYVMGQCLCNGHSDTCVPLPGDQMVPNKVYSGCMCEHNTDGERCEQCAPGFNNGPWNQGTLTDANVCQACICNEHSSDCEYIPAQSSAVCINCSNNTDGDQCNECLPTFFQDISLLLNDANVCQACDCSPLGVSDEGTCNEQGRCNCKNNVDSASVKCTECRDGYWNLTAGNPDGCQACDCTTEGTQQVSGLPLCDKQTGQCTCRPGAEGNRCDQCTPSFYDLSSGCLPCECNLGGAEGPACDQDSPVAQCPCKPNVDSILCTSPRPNYFFKLLDSIVFEAEEALFTEGTPLVFPTEWVTGPFTGRGFIAPPPHSDVKFTFSVPQDNQYEIIIRYETTASADSISFTLYSVSGVNLDLDCDATLVPTNVSRFQINSLQPGQRYFTAFSVCLDSTVQYQLLLEYNSFAPVKWHLDSLLLLPAFSEISAYYKDQSTQNQVDIIEPCLPRAASNQLDPLCEEVSFSLSTEFFGQVFACDCDPDGSVDNETCSPFGGSCAPCMPGVTGLRCDRCLNRRFGFAPGGCQECDCDPQGSSSLVCDPVSGQCTCQPGAGGRTCTECLPGLFNLTSTGCGPCECSEFASSETCDNFGQCSCPDGVGVLKCDSCLPGFYNISTEGCLQCECDPFGSSSDVCDEGSGQCVCTGNSIGLNCNECPDGTFLTNGISRERCVECICSGRTDVCTVDDTRYALGAIRSDFSVLCSLTPTNCSNGWRLLTSDGREAAPFGPSDAAGLGYILLLNHEPMFYAPDHLLGNRLGSYGFSFNVVVGVGQSFGSGILQVNSTIVRMVSSSTGVVLVGVFPYPGITENGFSTNRILSFSIPILEEHWNVGDATGPTPTRTQFLSVLSDIGELSFTAEYTQDIIEFIHISEISFFSTFSMTDLVNSNIEIITSPFPVEDCACPEGYSGSSCQDCARGFARLSGDITDTCVRCECNNLTLDCDVSSGACLDCEGNSEGANCERCRSGYYGDPTRNISCMQCACPLIDNSFSPTCFLDEQDDMQTCDNCAPGYAGRNCELCMEGYFGSPLLGGCNTCVCNRNVDPSLGAVCNTTTGQCMNCLNNTIGFECEICEPGYFGDPTLTNPDLGEPVWNQPCEACQCDPRGTVGDCDQLFGKCICQPNVMGALCDECEDGYWGLSQNLGCIPCDCCNNGSLSGNCNKETGACECLSNVGSEVDDKCCTCSPGFFNFSSTEGCDACNCSALAISNECDLLTGRCQCEEGAIGLKCDDCAFGFIGQVPNCERCHDCYFQWYDIVNMLASRISDLRMQVQSLITTYYNGHTLESIQNEIDLLLSQLDNATAVINSITLNENDVGVLEMTLAQLNSSLDDYTNRVQSIKQALDEAETNLMIANEFDGTVNMSDIIDIQFLINRYNLSIFMIIEETNITLDMLRQVQLNVYTAWNDLNDIDLLVEMLLSNLTENEDDVSEVDNHLMELVQSNYLPLRANLSYLDSQANTLANRLGDLSQSLGNASISLQVSNSSVSDLSEGIKRRAVEVELALDLARVLNETVRSAHDTALEANQTAHMLLEMTGETLEVANTTLTNLVESLQDVADVNSILNASKTVALDILKLRNPSVEYAETLAASINGMILPEDFVAEILRNASRSRMIAEEALSNVQEASSAVINASSLIENVEAYLNCTRDLHQQLETSLANIDDGIALTENHLEQINELSSMLEMIVTETDETCNDVRDTIDIANQAIANDLNMLNTLLEDTNRIANESQMYRQGVESVVDTYSTTLQSQVVNAHNEASSNFTVVESLYQQARNISDAARAVSHEDLTGLLQTYFNETIALNNLTSQVTAMQQELTDLTQSLTSAANRLQNCYKTP